ncbi:MAG: zinc-binding dehydrogenase [Propioniciclava sp.]|uniref:zinc-binding dehydrogenase n=1 Tax=Propioniciclava sp. TaxID=2038686 RepID=UPI0039E6BE9B
MRAVFVEEANPSDPLAALVVGERPEPEPAEGWVRVRVEAAAVNHHDVWSLRGVGLPADRMPMILGTDAAGVTEDGREVIVHAVITSPGWTGEETLDPRRSLLSELHQGTLAEWVTVPSGNLVDKPASLSFAEASCVPTAYLTAYRMLTRDSGLTGPGTVLVQGASGGVASAAIQLAKALGHRVWATARTDAKRAFAVELGADQAFEPGARLPERVDLVVETVGEATWSHSLKSLRPGGTVVVCGATSGANPPADLNRVFFLQLRVIGSTMGNRAELAELLDLLERTGVRPRIDRVTGFDGIAGAIADLEAGRVLGKVVLTPQA